MNKMVSITGILLLGLSAVILASCTGSQSEQAGSLPTLSAEPSTEFDEDAYRATLDEERRSARDYGIEDENLSTASADDGSPSSPEFNSSIFRASLQGQRYEARRSTMGQSSADSSFDYDKFMAQMTELRATQRNDAASGTSSSAGSIWTRSSVRGGTFGSLPQYPLDSYFNRSRSSSSSSPSSTNSTASSSSSSSGIGECGDGKDNDGDQLIDADDPDCHTDGNADYLPSYDYRRTSESQGQTSQETSSSSRASTFASTNRTTCADRSILPIFGDSAITGDRGATVPYVLSGDCPVVGAILPYDDNETVFGSMAF